MRVVVQRVKQASVHVGGNLISHIDQGYLLFVGLKKDDDKKIIEDMAGKISKLRIFSDNDGLMNLSIKQVNGEILSISQFTLYGDVKKQNRPGFTDAMAYDQAKDMYQYFNQVLGKHGLSVKSGVFGEHMEVHLVNDGPVTIIVDTDQ
jgi:D-tyrosyl-tRNA(Tyr) deacylase